MQLSSYFKASLIAFLDEKARDKVIGRLVELADQDGLLDDRQKFYKAILEREKIVSTGIGMGVALPHAKFSFFTDFFIVLGILKQRGVEWKALDGAPVRLIFLIGGPEDSKKEYLKLLSLLTRTVKGESFRKKLLLADSREEVLALFKKR